MGTVYWETNRISAIILAGGYSSRMGDFKPLLRLGKYRVIEHAVRCFLHAGITDVRVVTGYRGDEIAEVIKPMDIKVVLNPNFDQGMFSSVQAGVNSLENTVEAFFIMPADYPLVSVGTIKKMMRSYWLRKKGIIHPAYKNRRGHPTLISAGYISEILGTTYPDGLKGLLRKYEHQTIDVAVDDEAVLMDMDRRADYRKLLDYVNRQTIPTYEQSLQIMREFQNSKNIWEHSQMVARVSCALVKLLNQKSANLNGNLVLAGALLHDLARGQPEHAKAGARLLIRKGFPQVADVIAVHMDIEVEEQAFLTEAEVVYLADKLVIGNRLISISERLGITLEKNKGNEEACQAAARRLLKAELIQKKAERILGKQLETILLKQSFNSTDLNNLIINTV